MRDTTNQDEPMVNAGPGSNYFLEINGVSPAEVAPPPRPSNHFLEINGVPPQAIGPVLNTTAAQVGPPYIPATPVDSAREEVATAQDRLDTQIAGGGSIRAIENAASDLRLAETALSAEVQNQAVRDYLGEAEAEVLQAEADLDAATNMRSIPAIEAASANLETAKANQEAAAHVVADQRVISAFGRGEDPADLHYINPRTGNEYTDREIRDLRDDVEGFVRQGVIEQIELGRPPNTIEVFNPLTGKMESGADLAAEADRIIQQSIFDPAGHAGRFRDSYVRTGEISERLIDEARTDPQQAHALQLLIEDQLEPGDVEALHANLAETQATDHLADLSLVGLPDVDFEGSPEEIAAEIVQSHTRTGRGSQTIDEDAIAVDLARLGLTDARGPEIYDAVMEELTPTSGNQVMSAAALQNPNTDQIMSEAAGLIDANTNTRHSARGRTQTEHLNVNALAYDVEQLAETNPVLAVALRQHLVTHELNASEAAEFNRLVTGDANFEDNMALAFENPGDGLVGAGKGFVNGFSDLGELGIWAVSGHRFDVPEFSHDNRAQSGGANVMTAIELATGVKGLVSGGARAAAGSGDEILDLAQAGGRQIDEGTEASEFFWRNMEEAGFGLGDDIPGQPRLEPVLPFGPGVARNASHRSGGLFENSITNELRVAGYDVIEVTNRSGHGTDHIAIKPGDPSSAIVIESKANTSSLNPGQQLGGEAHFQSVIDRLTLRPNSWNTDELNAFLGRNRISLDEFQENASYLIARDKAVDPNGAVVNGPAVEITDWTPGTTATAHDAVTDTASAREWRSLIDELGGPGS